ACTRNRPESPSGQDRRPGTREGGGRLRAALFLRCQGVRQDLRGGRRRRHRACPGEWRRVGREGGGGSQDRGGRAQGGRTVAGARNEEVGLAIAKERPGFVMKLLLVEDDKDKAGYVRRALAEAGHVVDVAQAGHDGLMLAASEPYDVM